MGWLGYSEDVTRATRIPALELAYEGLVEKLALMHTGRITSALATPAEPVKPTSEQIMSAFRNAGAMKQR